MIALRIKENLEKLNIKAEIEKLKNKRARPEQETVETENKIQSLVDYKEVWRLFVQECRRVEFLLNNDSENTYKYIDYLNCLEKARECMHDLVKLEGNLEIKREKYKRIQL